MGNLIEWMVSAPSAAEKQAVAATAKKLVGRPNRFRRVGTAVAQQLAPQVAAPVEQSPQAPTASGVPPHLNAAMFLMQAFGAVPVSDEIDDADDNQPCKANSAKRDELLARLLNPTITLEETALILDTCTTTVRRYANMGLLTHVQAPGDQKRYRLSDVLAVMQNKEIAGIEEPEIESDIHTDTLDRARRSMKKSAYKGRPRERGAETD